MVKWEYRVINGEYPTSLQEWLNTEGEYGWELVHIEYGLFMVLKRAKITQFVQTVSTGSVWLDTKEK